MKKKILLISVCMLLLCGCGKIPKLENGEEAVVSFKDGKMISVDDFYQKIKNSYGLNTLISMIDKYIYENEFEGKKSEAEEYADAYIDQFISMFGSEENVLNYLQSNGIASIDAYKEVLYVNYLQNEAVMKYVEGELTDEEIQKYYDEEVYPNMTISHIIITPDVTSDMEEEDIDKAQEEAKKKLEDLIKELDTAKKNGEDVAAKFASLAKEYSEDDSTKDKGGDLGDINIGSLGDSYDELIKEAAKLKDGEYSSKVITTQAGYHIILKTKTGEKQSLDAAKDSIKEDLANGKLTNEDGTSNTTLIAQAVKHYREEYKVEINDDELKSQYGIYMNNFLNQNYQN